MPTCDRCKEHLALYDVAKAAVLLLADAELVDDPDGMYGYVVSPTLIHNLHEAVKAFNKCDHGAA